MGCPGINDLHQGFIRGRKKNGTAPGRSGTRCVFARTDLRVGGDRRKKEESGSRAADAPRRCIQHRRRVYLQEGEAFLSGDRDEDSEETHSQGPGSRSNPLKQVPGNVFHKGPDSQYFRLCYSTLP